MTQENHVVAAAIASVDPDGGIREDVEESRKFALDGLDVALIQRNVQREQTAGGQVRLHRFEVLFGINGGRALDKNIQRIGRDDIELVRRGQNVVPRVVEDDVGARVVHHV